MSGLPKQLFIALALILALGASATVGLAQSEGKGSRVGLMMVAADYIGLDRKELVSELRQGQSLAQVTTGQGKTVDGLKQALRNAVTAKLDADLAAGTLSAAKRDQILSRLDARLDRIVNRVWTPGERGGKAWKGGLMKAAGEYVGMSRSELRAELKAGKSLAQVAASRGKSVEGLKAALLSAVRANLDQLVTSGQLSAERRDKMLARIDGRLDKLVNRTRG